MISKNSEILFLYDAQSCNPNGDMDNENKPRMDYDTSINLVSDVRLKRYIRDYLEVIKNMEIFVTGSVESAKERSKQIKNKKITHTDLVDVRMFGVVTAEEDIVGGHMTGPIQFNWGHSLHPVELIDSSTITSSFSSGQGVGKDYRLHYSLIAFSGSINANIAYSSKLTDDDIRLFDESILHAIPLARTRSKIGQYPRLYLRIELKDNTAFLKDLRSMLRISSDNPMIAENPKLIRKPADYFIDGSRLSEYLQNNATIITTVYYWKDPELDLRNFDTIFSQGVPKHELLL
ncbi:MAG: type I-B CRISPR-associated protein Cas7/Csh2 [Candidatus Cloacimonetes bacterium]|nr:type I-B CRISPR-associated protein Cas7/Csh2 [Candidatus Cloacimonadota bacterium]